MFQIRDSDMDLSDDTKHSGVSSFAYTLRSIGPLKVPVAFDTDLALADKPAVARMGFEPIRRRLTLPLLSAVDAPDIVQRTTSRIELMKPHKSLEVPQLSVCETTSDEEEDETHSANSIYSPDSCDGIISWERAQPLFPEASGSDAKHSPADETGEQYKLASHLEGERGAEYFERVYTGRFDSVFERRAVTLDESTACACAMHALQGTPSILFEWDEDLCALRVIGGVVRGGETLPVRITGWSRTSTASALAPFAKVGTEVRRLGAMHRRAKAHRDDDALVHFYGTVEWALIQCHSFVDEIAASCEVLSILQLLKRITPLAAYADAFVQNVHDTASSNAPSERMVLSPTL